MTQPLNTRLRLGHGPASRNRCASPAWALVALAPLIAAQDAPPSGDRPVRDGLDAPVIDPLGSAQPVEGAEPADQSVIGPRTPLIREGAFLTDAVGRLIRDADTGAWILELEPRADQDSHPRHMVVLPCERLQHMERVVAASDLDVIFQITGRVFVFDNLNYVLPLDAPRLERYEAAPAAEAAEEVPADADAEPLVPPGATAQDVIERLKRDVPLPRSLDATPPVDEVDSGAGEPQDPPTLAAPLHDGSMITLRRGRVQRHGAGGWVFTMDADASGLADPPLAVLPCLLLEKMREDSLAVSRGDGMLVTGEVFAYRGRNYLLPTMYRIERLRSNIH